MSNDDSQKRLSYEKGDIRAPSVPGGQRKRPQNEQMREEKRKRKKYHERHRSKENRDARKRYRLKYKRNRKMIERKRMYQQDPSRYTRRPPKPYTKPDKEAVAQRYAGRLWYHGSPKRFEGLRTYEGHTFGKVPSEIPLFFSPKKSFAKMYATGPEGTIYTVRLKWRKVFDSEDLYRDSRYWPPEYDDLTPEGKALYDDLAEGKVFAGVDEDDLVDGYPSLWEQVLRMDYDIIEDAAFKRWLRKNGYDAAYVTGDGEQNVFVFSPKQVEIVEVTGMRDKKAAGDIFLYDQHNPANNEIKQPGADVDYRAEGPSTWALHPDLQQGIAQTDGGISDQTRNVPPGSSRVIPDAMKQQLQDNYYKASGRRSRRISKAIALNSIYSRIRDIKYGSARLIGPSTPTEWLISYESHDGDTHRVHVGGHEDSTGRVSLSVRTASTDKTAAATIPEVLSNCGPLVTDRSKGLKFRRKRLSPSGMSTWAVTGSTGEVYTVKVKPIQKDKRVKTVAKMPVRLSCSCPYWRWQGPEHWGKQNDYLYGKPRGTASFPIVRDPLGEHWACKHVIAVLQLVKNYRRASEEEDQWSYEGPYDRLPDEGRVAARYYCQRVPKTDPKPEE